MEMKTKVHAEVGRHDVMITREFDLPVGLLFKAYEEPRFVEQWMGTKVMMLECRRHGGYEFVTTDPKGNQHIFSGAFHDVVPESKIVRTFEMQHTPFPVQLELLDFEAISEHASRLVMHIIYRSVADRDRMLQLPFAQGISMAHDRIQEMFQKYEGKWQE